MALPLAYHDSVAIQEVAVDVWKEVFEATGWPVSLVPKALSQNDACRLDVDP
jgi:hypothetical protein